MTQLDTYLPQDRLRALARGETLPDRTTGAARRFVVGDPAIQRLDALAGATIARTDAEHGERFAVATHATGAVPERAGLREGLVLALRLGALPRVVSAVKNFAYLAHAEGQTGRALALLGLARRHPAWSSDLQRHTLATLARWALDPAVAEAGQAQGAGLDWDATIQELLRA
jgi:hypothetical protein